VRVTILSRASDLARLQAMLVGRALLDRWPDTGLTYLTRTSAGDRDNTTALAALPDKGAFTADLTDLLRTGTADLVVHSWKDLPLEDRPATVIAATLERADPRDVLLVRRQALDERPRTLQILSSSPRRMWLLDQVLPALLPWPIDTLEFAPVRGNIQTRLRRLIEGRGHALVVAKAALDRLLGFGRPFEDAARVVSDALERSAWMVLPIREVPGAPAQGAVAVEMARTSPLLDRIREISHAPTWHAVMRERDVLAAYGGGCHEALGATVLPRDFGRVVSVRGRTSSGRRDEGWSLVDVAGETPPRVAAASVWPRPDERHHATRRPLEAMPPDGNGGFWIARADALPQSWRVPADRLVWAAGTTTWRKLAARGVWVNGCADGLGDADAPDVDLLADRQVRWHRLTHQAAATADPDALATYVVDNTLPDDLAARTHFFWTSGSEFLEALARWPQLRQGWHGSGPGRTWRTLHETLGPTARARVWLDYEHWQQEVLA
jgi:hydroxymethylbilane synthase